MTVDWGLDGWNGTAAHVDPDIRKWKNLAQKARLDN